MILRYPSIISWQACCSFLLSIISIYYPISMKCVILSQANYFCLLNTYIWFSKGSDCVCLWIMNWRWRFLVHNTIQYLSMYLWFLKFGTAKFHAPHFIVKYLFFLPYFVVLFMHSTNSYSYHAFYLYIRERIYNGTEAILLFRKRGVPVHDHKLKIFFRQNKNGITFALVLIINQHFDIVFECTYFSYIQIINTIYRI